MKHLVKTWIIVIAILFISLPSLVFAAETQWQELSSKTQLVESKEWSIKFNLLLKKETVNNKNITVVNENGIVIKVPIDLAKDGQTIIVGSPTSGYIPGSSYFLNISKNVKSEDGKNLDKSTRMKFTISNKYNLGSMYNQLPMVDKIELQGPVIAGQPQDLYITAKNMDKVQYRIFTYDYKSDCYEEITKGYTEIVDGKTPYKVTFTKLLKEEEKYEGRKYKLLVYVKRANIEGAHKDNYTDYDNYYIDYFKCITQIDTTVTKNVTYDKSLAEFAEKQIVASQTDEANRWVTPNKNQVLYYLNPCNFMDEYGKYQFLKLNYTDGITKENLDEILKGKGVLENKGEVFLRAAKENNVSPIYLVSHALHETGNGTSILAKGVSVGAIDGKPLPEAKVTYNMFGIKAVDGNAIKSGAEYAFKQQWFTVEDAILGGAVYISTQYINNPIYKQDTLYKMRWNPGKNVEHQYATNIGWAYIQIKDIKEMLDQCRAVTLEFEMPVYTQK